MLNLEGKFIGEFKTKSGIFKDEIIFTKEENRTIGKCTTKNQGIYLIDVKKQSKDVIGLVFITYNGGRGVCAFSSITETGAEGMCMEIEGPYTEGRYGKYKLIKVVE